MRARLLLSLALAAASVPCFALSRARAPGTEELLQSTGLVRGLPVPFLWSGLGKAADENELERTLEIGRLLLRVVPEYEMLWRALALRYAFPGGRRPSTPAAQAARLADALHLLSEAAERHPRDEQLPATAAYLLYDFCLGTRPGSDEVRAELEKLTGIDSELLAARELGRAGERSDRPLRYDVLAGALALVAWRDGQRALAIQLFERGARLLEQHPSLEADVRALDARRIRLFRQVAAGLRADPPEEITGKVLEELRELTSLR